MVLLYGLEGWTLNKETIRRLESFEMQVYSHVLKISLMDYVTNNSVEKIGKGLEILFAVKKRKLEFLGHTSHGTGYKLLKLIMQGKLLGKRSVGYCRISWLHD